ncbi:S1C family serine protease [Chloroflexota bacterium]
MKKSKVKYLTVFLLIILLLMPSTGCAIPYVEISPPQNPPAQPAPAPPLTPSLPPTPINPTWTPPQSENQSEILPSIADVVALVKPSVVAINTEVVSSDFFNRPFTQEGAGSGWILDEGGIIITNNHVVEGADTITATLDDGSTYEVDISTVFTDHLNDLAIFKIDAQNLPALKVGNSSQLKIGDWVVAIGNALGQGIRATQGIVSRQGVSIPLDQGQTLYDLIETTAAINPGNSGGPLVNLSGEVIGITSAKIASIGVEGMGYAISTETAVPIIEQLIKNGYVIRPWLGVGLYTVDQFVVMRYELAVDKGVLITQIVEGGPAIQAGLDVGDIIVAIDGEATDMVMELTRILHAAQIGQKIAITFWRDDEQFTIEVTLAENPPPL